MTKSAYGENPTEMKITRLVQLHRENFTPEGTHYIAGAISFGRNRKSKKHHENTGKT